MAKERSREGASELRKRAEKILASDPEAIRTVMPADIQKLIHELNVHQIELEMQNAELRRVQLELQGARDKYLNLYDFAPTGHFTLDRNSLIVDVNLAGSELLGSEKHRLIGAQFTSSISPDSQDAFYFHYREVLKTGIKGTCEVKMLKADGTPFHAQLISMAVPEKDGDISQCRTAVVDITERKNMQAQLMAQDRLASIGQLVSGVAHELNNPLTGVIGFSELLLKRELPDDIKKDLKIINDEAQRTARIVKNLLIFARKQSQEKQPIDINESIQTVLELRAHEQKVSNIKVNTRLAPDLPQIMGNSSQLQQVFFNIVINAEFFMSEAHERGTMTITTERIGNSVRASLADDGPGISKESMSRLFSPFFTTKEVGQGTGLGLSICHGIITEHGGRIYAESELGKGATFIIELPIRQGEKDEGVLA
jgi:two-component system, NtrC family, sensor kinase